jgi:hypothetical protein
VRRGAPSPPLPSPPLPHPASPPAPWIRRITTNGSERPNGNKEERSRCCRRRVTTGERELESGNTAGLNRQLVTGEQGVNGSTRMRAGGRNSKFGVSRAPIRENPRSEKRILNKYATSSSREFRDVQTASLRKMRSDFHREFRRSTNWRQPSAHFAKFRLADTTIR